MRAIHSLLLIISSSLVTSKFIKYNWDLEEIPLKDSTFHVNIIAINKQFSGPRVECSAGDTLVIKVNNKLKREISIHWHGITQKHASNMDGVPYISHSPILPNSTYEYTLNVHDQTGTYWYHAHTGLDAELLFGPLMIQDSPEVWSSVTKFNKDYYYDSEEVILLSELWEKDHQEMLYGLTNVPFQFIGQSKAVLINGKPNENKSIFKVKPNKKYRLRVIGANGFSIMTFRIPNHKFTVIEVDGTLIDPIKVDYLLVNAGQRYSVILETNQNPADYSIMVQKVSINSLALSYGEAVLSYENTNKNKFVEAKRINQALNRWIIPKISTSKWYLTQKNDHYYSPPKEIDQDIVFNVAGGNKDGVPNFNINNKLLKPSNFLDLINSKNSSTVYQLKLGQRVQFVIQHITTADGACGQHPWHFHGHSFHVVDNGPGFYNPKKDLKLINQKLSNSTSLPIFRDTFTQFPYETPDSSMNSKPSINNNPDNPSIKSCGWIAIRFIANNPGNWIIHCHITAHLVMGKVLVVQTTN